MTPTIGPRCPYLMHDSARPRLAAVEAAKIAGALPPVPDWRCVRRLHTDTPYDQLVEHLAMPLGITGASIRFSGTSGVADGCAYCLDPTNTENPCPVCGYGTGDTPDDYHLRGVYCGEPSHCGEPFPGALPGTPYLDYAAANVPRPDLDGDQPDPPAAGRDLAALVDQLARRGVGVVRAQPGDTLLLVVPELDANEPEADAGPSFAERMVRQLAELVPSVGILALTGCAGVVVVPPPPAGAAEQVAAALPGN